jgi:uncharacterized membrane protein HdeD (DUF308 family)
MPHKPEKRPFKVPEIVSTPLRGDHKMNTDKIKWILLGVYLILAGLVLLGVNLGGNIVSIVAGIAAIIAGVLFLINR